MELAQLIRTDFPDRTLSGIGGVEDGDDAAMFLLVGAHTVQVCTGVMIHGYGLINTLRDGLAAFMAKHNFATVEDFRGHSIQYFTTHADLVARQAKARADAKAKRADMIQEDSEWSGDKFVEQSDKLVSE